MYRIHVTRTVSAPLTEVFALVADHERFLRGAGIDRCLLTQVGAPDRNGLGAVRRVEANGYVFDEEITRFEPPHRFDYLILRLVNARGRSLPFEHRGGTMEFREEADGTRIDWRSEFRFTIPLLGWLVERFQGRSVARTFGRLLEQARSQLEAPTVDS